MREYFQGIPVIKYEGKNSKNPFSFKYYNAEEMIGDKTMKEHLKFTMSYWHTIAANGSDMFGAGTYEKPWDNDIDPIEVAKAKMEAAFEFMDKLGIEYFAFHDRDIAPEGKDLREANKNLEVLVAYCKEQMQSHQKKLLWGTANAFNHPRYVHGAATSCNAEVFSYAAAQVKKAMDITKELGGENYVFWGGREGYETLLNTDLKLEQDNFARFLRMAVDYAKKIDFQGQLLIEPKPQEPTKHQYDYDVATVLAFLRAYGLDKHFKMNIEANHATLAGHTFQHEVAMARINGVLGSLDINQGDPNLGWDTDQFPTNIYDAVLLMYEVLKNGGIGRGGLNFDAKVRRASFKSEDLFLGYIAGMDTLAQGLRIAYRMLQEGEFEKHISKRYHSYTEGIGKAIVEGIADFETLEKYALEHSYIENESGRQELLEAKLNQYIFNE